mmetsp:Transcript_92331/g.246976  ORF Transcript_92331/g.246976 Transcript_92331/m.246976 type:complete len:409 (-) Transcript_92331:123-1349(-)
MGAVRPGTVRVVDADGTVTDVADTLAVRTLAPDGAAIQLFAFAEPSDFPLKPVCLVPQPPGTTRRLLDDLAVFAAFGVAEGSSALVNVFEEGAIRPRYKVAPSLCLLRILNSLHPWDAVLRDLPFRVLYRVFGVPQRTMTVNIVPLLGDPVSLRVPANASVGEAKDAYSEMQADAPRTWVLQRRPGVVLVDGHSLAHYGLPGAGPVCAQPTGAPPGTLFALRRVAPANSAVGPSAGVGIEVTARSWRSSEFLAGLEQAVRIRVSVAPRLVFRRSLEFERGVASISVWPRAVMMAALRGLRRSRVIPVLWPRIMEYCALLPTDWERAERAVAGEQHAQVSQDTMCAVFEPSVPLEHGLKLLVSVRFLTHTLPRAVTRWQDLERTWSVYVDANGPTSPAADATSELVCEF